MMRRESCEKCKGSKHIKKAGKFVPCVCLEKERIAEVLRESHVDAHLRMRGGKLSDPKKIIQRILEDFKIVNRGILIMLRGGGVDIRWKVASRVLWGAAHNGQDVYVVDFHEFIDAHFPEGEKKHKIRCFECDALWLKFDHPREHAWRESLFMNLLVQRSDRVTMTTSPVDMTCSSFPIRHKSYDLSSISWEG